MCVFWISWGCVCLTIHASWGSLLYSWIGSLWLGGHCWLRGCRRGGSNAVRGSRALLRCNHCGSCYEGKEGDGLHTQAYETLKVLFLYLWLHSVTYLEPGPHSDQMQRWHSCWPRPGFLTGRRLTCWLRWLEWPVSRWGLSLPLCLHVHPLILDTVTENFKNQLNSKDFVCGI